MAWIVWGIPEKTGTHIGTGGGSDRVPMSLKGQALSAAMVRTVKAPGQYSGLN